MSRLTVHSIDSAPEQSQPRIAAAEKANGFIPNLIGVLANAPTALEMYQEVGKMNAKSSLSAAEREVVQITAAVTNGCGFCVAGHSAITQKNSLMSDDVLQALREVKAFAELDTKLNALARFTLEVMQHQGNVDDNALADFFAAGYNQQQAIEAIAGVALATLCNYANNLARTEINPQLQPFA